MPAIFIFTKKIWHYPFRIFLILKFSLILVFFLIYKINITGSICLGRVEISSPKIVIAFHGRIKENHIRSAVSNLYGTDTQTNKHPVTNIKNIEFKGTDRKSLKNKTCDVIKMRYYPL